LTVQKFDEGLASSQRVAEVFEVNEFFGLLTVSLFTLANAAPSAVWAKKVGEAAILGDRAR